MLHDGDGREIASGLRRLLDLPTEAAISFSEQFAIARDVAINASKSWCVSEEALQNWLDIARRGSKCCGAPLVALTATLDAMRDARPSRLRLADTALTPLLPIFADLPWPVFPNREDHEAEDDEIPPLEPVPSLRLPSTVDGPAEDSPVTRLEEAEHTGRGEAGVGPRVIMASDDLVILGHRVRPRSRS